MKKKLSERIGEAAANVVLYLTIACGVVLVVTTCIGCVANSIEGFVDLSTGVVGK